MGSSKLTQQTHGRASNTTKAAREDGSHLSQFRLQHECGALLQKTHRQRTEVCWVRIYSMSRDLESKTCHSLGLSKGRVVRR